MQFEERLRQARAEQQQQKRVGIPVDRDATVGREEKYKLTIIKERKKEKNK